jgi:hypothetical protein
VTVDQAPPDLDATRATIAARELVATASGYLTADVAVQIPFESLGPFKNLLKQFFSTAPWSGDDAAALSDIVTADVHSGWWEHDLGSGIKLAHGIRDGSYRLWVWGATDDITSIFDRAFDGPVVPAATPHPRKVKFVFGGRPSPGLWHRRGDADPPQDERVKRLMMERDITDVMVAGDFVTIGLAGTASWEKRLEPLLALVTEMFAGDDEQAVAPERTREELLQEAGHLHVTSTDTELHLLDPNDPDHRGRLTDALDSDDARTRRVAVAILAESGDTAARDLAVDRGYSDRSRIVRRTAVDAAADAGDADLRGFFETALTDRDPWIRWRAVKALGDLGVAASKPRLAALKDDPEFRVRFEAERVLHEPGASP